MPTDVFENSNWIALTETSQPGVLSTISEIIVRDKHQLAESFYNAMLTNPVAASFLSVNTVESRLKPGLERWLETLFCRTGDDNLEAAIAMQRQVGEVHARAEIPVNLVAIGFRLLKRELNLRLLGCALEQNDKVTAILRVGSLMDIAFEEMTFAYSQSHDKGIRNEEAFRLFSAGHNLAAEREKQMVAILEWENKLFRNIATHQPINGLAPIQSSAFGLWLHHKAPLIFDHTRELLLLDECLDRVDQFFLPQISDNHSVEIAALIKNILIETEQLKFLLNSMFDRLTDMEVGRDPLTQLFNRRFLPAILKREIEISRRKGVNFAVLMLDVDLFKKVNDAHGHEAGDRVLQQVATLALNRLRAGDFVFRYGGEEFLVVLTEVDGNQALEVAEKIRQRIESTIILLANDNSLSITISVGLALSDGHPDYQRLIDRADEALYAAKNSGRNRCVMA